MKASLNIYKDCTSEEPSKVYTCNRLLYGTAKKLEEISRKAQKAKEEDQEKYTIEFLQTIFKDFDEDELNYIDTTEYLEFVRMLGGESQRILEATKKN